MQTALRPLKISMASCPCEKESKTDSFIKTLSLIKESKLLVLIFELEQLQSHHYTEILNLLQHWLQGTFTSVKNVMPGACYPSNFMMPQQSYHCCMFPLAGCYENFQCVSNPYDCSIGEIRVLETSR
ncbi:hypothetical protein GQX74_001830 [Glossina fuscipes]|nr:hypothetical protein GQX74_001830 [Glossina fuscipes]